MTAPATRRASRGRLVVPAALTVTIVVAASSLAVPACGENGEPPPVDAPTDAPADASIDAPDANPPFD